MRVSNADRRPTFEPSIEGQNIADFNEGTIRDVAGHRHDSQTAERGRFELPEDFHPHRFSRAAP